MQPAVDLCGLANTFPRPLEGRHRARGINRLDPIGQRKNVPIRLSRSELRFVPSTVLRQNSQQRRGHGDLTPSPKLTLGFSDRDLTGFKIYLEPMKRAGFVAPQPCPAEDVKERVNQLRATAGRRVQDGAFFVLFERSGQPSYTIHRPAAYDFVSLSEQDRAAIGTGEPSWIYYGTLHQMSVQAKTLTRELFEMFPRARRLYDVNLRRDSYNPSLVRELMQLATTLKINDEEVAAVEAMLGTSHGSLESFCRAYSAEFGWDTVCVTQGATGCSVLNAEEFVEAPGYQVQVVDTVGAGDAFAAAFVHGLDRGWSAKQLADLANRVGALVASRAGGVPFWTTEEVVQVRRS